MLTAFCQNTVGPNNKRIIKGQIKQFWTNTKLLTIKILIYCNNALIYCDNTHLPPSKNKIFVISYYHYKWRNWLPTLIIFFIFKGGYVILTVSIWLFVELIDRIRDRTDTVPYEVKCADKSVWLERGSNPVHSAQHVAGDDAFTNWATSTIRVHSGRLRSVYAWNERGFKICLFVVKATWPITICFHFTYVTPLMFPSTHTFSTVWFI